jgi:CheY-like chemotaxis protein
MDSTPIDKIKAVLIIDRDPTGAENIKQLLEDRDFRVYTANTLKESHRFVTMEKIDVALLVIRQSIDDPKQLITELRQKIDGADIPIIVILESFEEEIVASALKAGAVDFLTLPVESQELIKRIGVQIRMFYPESKSNRGGFLARLLTRFSGGLFLRSSTQEIIGGRYEKLRRLGIGSFGEVWKISDILEQPPFIYVAKIPLSKKFNAKIEKEARILKRLSDHSCVPKFREIIEEKNKTILIQEFVFGKELIEVIERELEDKEVESIIMQLADVVAHAHDFEIIHRDIKPGNIMVRPDGTIKLLDFGVAKELKGKTFSETVTGSRPYMSPEQIMGKSQKRSDVWALGVVMYVLYTGMFPFYHEVEKVLMDIILRVPPSPPSKFNEDLDPGIERIILKCLEKSPENRYPDARALKEDILDYFPGYGETILPLY